MSAIVSSISAVLRERARQQLLGLAREASGEPDSGGRGHGPRKCRGLRNVPQSLDTAVPAWIREPLSDLALEGVKPCR
jgi:hypothetical protein